MQTICLIQLFPSSADTKIIFDKIAFKRELQELKCHCGFMFLELRNNDCTMVLGHFGGTSCNICCGLLYKLKPNRQIFLSSENVNFLTFRNNVAHLFFFNLHYSEFELFMNNSSLILSWAATMVVSTVPSQQEDFWFESWLRPLSVQFACSHRPKTRMLGSLMILNGPLVCESEPAWLFVSVLAL